jgi:TPR repeat protein
MGIEFRLSAQLYLLYLIMLEPGILCCFCLGIAYLKGRGVPQDHKTAVKWFRLAAGQGYAEAQSNLGWMYQNGWGVIKDYKSAVYWYELAFGQGHSGAASGDAITIDGTAYTVRVIQPEGTGVTTLVLEKN